MRPCTSARTPPNTSLTFTTVTTEVSSYPLVLKGHEVFLIDSPGFDDDKLSSDDVLQKIADFINGVHSLGWRIGGIIYLHDITRERMGSSGEMNVRLLERLTGEDNWNNITLVTTKWGISGRSQSEIRREQELQEKTRYWGDMCNANRPAAVCRFDNTESGAKEIIERHLELAFVPRISQQMVENRAALGDTDAGQVIRSKYAAVFTKNGEIGRLQQMNERMESTFHGSETRQSIQALLRDLHKLERKQMLQQVGRWAVRLVGYGGALVVSVATENPEAFKAALKMAGPLEMTFQQMKSKTKYRGAELRGRIANTALYGTMPSSGIATEVYDEEEM